MMLRLLIIAGLLLIANTPLFSQAEEAADSTNTPIIRIKPDYMVIDKPDGRFISKIVKVMNTGGGELIIKNVVGSCSCSTAKIMDSHIGPLEIGKLMLNINLDGLEDGNDTVFFYVESNASVPTVSIKVKINDTDKELTPEGEE